MPAASRHGQLNDSPLDTLQPYRPVTYEAAADQADVRTPTWPASPPPSGYATPAVAVTSLAADAQLNPQSSPGSQASQASHPGSISIMRAAMTMSGSSSHSLSAWPAYTAVALAPGIALSSACLTRSSLNSLPNELLLHILRYLDVCDLLATSRVSDTRLRLAYKTAPVPALLCSKGKTKRHCFLVGRLFTQLLTLEISRCRRQTTSSAPCLSRQFSTSTGCSEHASFCLLSCHPLTVPPCPTSSLVAYSSPVPRWSRASWPALSCRSASRAASRPARLPKLSSSAASSPRSASPV